MNTKNRVQAAATAITLALALMCNAAHGATAVGHVSVTILPTAAGVTETTPIEMGAAGRHMVTRPGVVTLTGAPNEAVTISVSANDAVTGPGPALQLSSFTHNAGRAPMLTSDGSLSLAVATTVKTGGSQPHGAYAGNYSVIVNY